ncbi:MAG TPA: hypothetical protein VMH23_13975 [Bacteroidota bacterium]|nr:hypothetical protein [Bacteroidota bacterium]
MEPALLWKAVVETFESAAKIIALLVGGLWTYELYIKQRTKYPRLQITHAAKVMSLGKEFSLLSVTVTVKNIGNVLVAVDRCRASLFNITDDHLNLTADSDENSHNPARCEDGLRLRFPRLRTLERKWEIGKFELEPQEQDQVVFDFVLPASVEAVRLYTYFSNPKKQDRNIGWSDSSIHRVETLKEGVAY